MIEKIGTIKNPLTIIAIFAAIAEISGTGVLPFIAPANQATYIWFLIIFPILLILFFFLTLNFNHRVLYAPSDYQNEGNFLKSLPHVTLAEKALQMDTENAETLEEITSNKPVALSNILTNEFIERNPQVKHILAEDLAIQKLSKEFSSKIERNVRIDNQLGRHIFDGIVRDKGITTAIEVQFLNNDLLINTRLRNTITRIYDNARLLLGGQTTNFRVLLAFVTEDASLNQIRISDYINTLRQEFPFPIEVRFHYFPDLEQEYIKNRTALVEAT